jgi:hypothetical protein
MISASHGMHAVVTDTRDRRFELLAMSHLDAAFNLARWLTGNMADAENVVQDAYRRAFRYLDTFRGEFPRLAADPRAPRSQPPGPVRRQTRRASQRSPWGSSTVPASTVSTTPEPRSWREPCRRQPQPAGRGKMRTS